jgi:type IV secretory pathway TraG/TraD family ATPase VirD4
MGPPIAYWTVTLLVCTLAGGLVWAVRQLWRDHGPGGAGQRERDPQALQGLASRRQVKTAAGPKALVARAAVLRPSVSHPGPRDVGFGLGRSRGMPCWAGVRDSTVVLGPPGAGKGLHLVIPTIMDFPGPVITTSTRTDNLAVTLAARSRHGPVALFDPQHLARGAPSTTRWSPIRGCERAQTAMARAVALVGRAGRGTENENYWTRQTIQAVRCLLHAAALDGRQAVDLYRWSLSPANAKEAIEIMRADTRAGVGWSRALDAIVTSDPRSRDPVWGMVSNTFSALADPDVLDTVSPGPEERFDPRAFLRSGGTMFLLGMASETSPTAGLVSAFIEDVVTTARRLAAASPGARLDPPLGLVLDEAANYPLPSLSGLMSEGGGTGICTLVVLQSLAQARDRWGRERAQAIWDAATIKVVLGGQANSDDLTDMSRLLGEVEVRETTESYGQGGQRSTTVAVRSKPILTPSQLRTLPFGTGVLLLRSAPPIMLALDAWTGRPDAATLTTDKEQLEQSLRAAADIDGDDPGA